MHVSVYATWKASASTIDGHEPASDDQVTSLQKVDRKFYRSQMSIIRTIFRRVFGVTATWLVMNADVQSSSPQTATVQSQSELKSRIAERVPRFVDYVKEKPLVGWTLKRSDLDDVPEVVRTQLGAVDSTKYSPSFLADNRGTIIALQMDGSKPDFYIIRKAAFDTQYEEVELEQALQKNPALTAWVKAQPGLAEDFEAHKDMLQGAHKAMPVKMIKLSDLGYSIDQPVTIQSPWGGQTKPAGEDAYLALDVLSNDYYLVNQGDEGNPLSYVPQL